jgi:glycosyltransferase involved in cell wall biosynthesis
MLDRPLSICIVTQQFRSVLSGIGVHARNLATRLAADGHRVTVVGPEDQRPEAGPPLSYIGVPPARLAGSQARWVSLSVSFARALRAAERRARFDLVHFTDARESLFCRAAAPMIGNVNDTYAAEVRSLASYRRYYHDWAARWAYYRAVHLAESIALPRLTAVLANSRYTARAVITAYRIAPGRLHVCHKSVDPARYQAARALRAALPPHPPRVLFVGGNMQRKGLPTLIRALQLVRRAVPGAGLWVVGRDGAAGRMQALARSEGVGAAVCFLGLQDQNALLASYASVDVFALPSLTEAFGVALLEAMAAGVPVVATQVGGIPEIVEHERNGLLVVPDAPDALAQAIIRLLQDAALRERLAAAGLETVERFSLDRMMACTYGVYERVLNPASALQEQL